MKKRLIAAAALATAAGLALSGVASGAASARTETATTAAKPTRGGTLTWGWALPSTWDPVSSAVGLDVSALSLTYEGLTEENAKGTVQPGLAKSWTYNSAGNAVTFHLRPGLTFSDGTALDATAVKASLTRAQTEKDSTVAPQLTDITSITADSATDVTLHLSDVNYQIPLLMAGKTGLIVSPTAVAKDGVAKLATQPVGAGPFILTNYVPGSQATLKRNPKFWDASKIYLNGLILKTTPEASVATAGLQSGQYDVADVQPSQVSGLQAANISVLTTANALPVRTIDVNNTVKPFNNPKVIQAINYAINRKALIKAANFGFGTPQWQPFPNGYVAHDKSLDNLYPYNLKKAKALLKAAGYPKGVSITMAQLTADDPVGELLQQQLGDAGIKVKLVVETPGVNNYVTLQYPFALDQFNARQSPVQALQVLFGAQGLLNLGKGTPAALAPAVTAAQSLPLTSPKYPAAIQKATNIAVKGMPNVFLYSVTRFTAHTSKVQGLQKWADIVRFDGVWLKK